MNSEFYKFQSDENQLLFTFQSVSDKQIIDKVILYSPLPDNPEIFNLALGDVLETGELCDLTISNNMDLEKIMATVIQTMLLFFKKHPNCFIYFKGSSPERTRLYRIIISKEFDGANKIFDIYGIIDDNIMPFEKNQPYTSFVVALKKQNFK